MPKLLAVAFTSDTASLELFDKESLRLKQVPGIDIQNMKDDMLRHHLIMHASRMDTFSKVREVQDVARAREAAGGVVSIQIGAVKTRVIGARKASSCKLTRREMTPRSWQRRTSTSSASTAKSKVTSKEIAETTSVT